MSHEPKSTIRHMCLDIEGALKNRRKIRYMSNEDGTQATDKEARDHLKSLLAQGHTVMSCSSECDNFDPFDKGCMGHDADEWNERKRLKKMAKLEAELAELKGGNQ